MKLLEAYLEIIFITSVSALVAFAVTSVLVDHPFRTIFSRGNNKKLGSDELTS
jgi:hypothetical protein